MLCLTLILFAIVSCGAREIASVTDEAVYHITTAELTALPPGTESRIVGGSPTDIMNYPYAAQVLHNSRLACGGSILTVRHILSAAHCFSSDNGGAIAPRFYSVRVGSTFLDHGGRVVSVSTISRHEQYVHRTFENDIAVLRLSSTLTLGGSIQQAVIPRLGDVVPDNSSVIAVGWGTTNPVSQTPSSVLNHVSVYIVNRQICQSNYGVPPVISANMICAGLLGAGGADSCQGDSGGPLIYNRIVVGITSFGADCASPWFPGVYTQVSRYTNWIEARVSSAPSSYNGIAALLLPTIFLILTF